MLPDIKKIRTLLVTFNNKLSRNQITAFRGAIIEKAGRENLLFHNHLNDNTFLYKYPLVQYKMIKGRPAIFCVDAGVDEIHKLFGQKNWVINLKGEDAKLEIEDLNLSSNVLEVNGIMKTYGIHRWQALNESNYRKYQALDSMAEKLQMLERIMVGNILSFAKGIDWHIKEKIEVRILDMPLAKTGRVKDIKVNAFDLTFRSNVSLPDWMGLGKGSSTGFGIIHEIKK